MIAFALIFFPFFIIGGFVFGWAESAKVYGIAVVIAGIIWGIRTELYKKAGIEVDEVTGERKR